jgi:KDO2-lipid IV(A) lauroyltransferase
MSEEIKLRHRTFKKRAELLAGRLAVTSIARISKKLTPRRIRRWGAWLGDFMYVASSRYRGVAVRNLRAAFPEWSESQVRRVARDTFRNFARVSLEFFYLHELPPDQIDKWIDVVGMEHLDAALKGGRGVVVVTAHLGNWELLARTVAQMGYKISVIARDSDDPTMTGTANTIRQKAGYKVLPRDAAVLPAIRCLKKNEILGILPDQNTLSGIFVDFFGRPVATATGPAVFALKTGAPILCAFARRAEEGRFVAEIQPPLDVPLTGDDEADIHAVTAAFTKVIEDEIRKDPAQWLWVHDRWRRTSQAPGWGGTSEKQS